MTWRRRARRASSRFVRSSISTPALARRRPVDLEAGLGRGRAQRLGEGRAIALHHEAEDVPAEAAPEAVPRLAGRGDDERGRLLPVEGAQALVRGSRLLQRDGLADDVDDPQLALDF